MHELCTELSKRQSIFILTAYGSSSELLKENIFRAPCRGLLAFGLYALWRGGMLLWCNPGIEVVFGGSVLTAPLILLLGRIFKRKAVVQAHGLDLVYPNFFYQFLCVRWIKYCDRVVANSTYTAALAKEKGVSAASVSVIPPGVQPERFQSPDAAEATRKRFELHGKRIILFVGRLAKRKGVKEFIQHSLRRIVTEIPDACLVIAGDSPTESLTHQNDTIGEVEAAISAGGLPSHVRMLGALPDADVVGLYQACQVVVLPALKSDSDVEGFGIVLIEAAAAGKPTVATRVGGIPDAVEDGKTGFLIEPGDYDHLSDVIISILTDGETKRVMGEAAMRRIQEKFSWPKVVARYEVEFELSVLNQN
jgi:phosphatidylinositol alpha-1,6-mannosyltransferase